MTLPDNAVLDIGVLAGLFRNTTNSYKYLFFHSLLDALEKRYQSVQPDADLLSLHELAVGMLVNAWYPRAYFKLSFGRQDKVGAILDQFTHQYPLDVTCSCGHSPPSFVKSIWPKSEA